MKLVKSDVVTIQFTVDEARRFGRSLFDDFTWSETTEEGLYTLLWELLDDALDNELSV